MKKIIATFLLSAFAASAFASCPQTAPYKCKQTIGGKMLCGCGV
jgi:hypothetical protein